MVKPETNFVIGFDPGIRNAGIAIVNRAVNRSGWRLLYADLIRNPITKGNDIEAIRALVERATFMLSRHFDHWPARGGWCLNTEFFGEIAQIYDSRIGANKGVNPNDLPHLTAITTVMGIQLVGPGHAHQFRPAEWKGQVDADTMTERIRSRLDAGETATLKAAACPASLEHNVLDAIGIAFKAVGRLEPIRVHPF